MHLTSNSGSLTYYTQMKGHQMGNDLAARLQFLRLQSTKIVCTQST